LSRKELLALLAAKDERIDALLVQVGELTAQVQTLVLKLGKDSAPSWQTAKLSGIGSNVRPWSLRWSSGSWIRVRFQWCCWRGAAAVIPRSRPPSSSRAGQPWLQPQRPGRSPVAPS
jgi:hypothetical protein